MAVLADQTLTLTPGEQRLFGGPVAFVFFRNVAAAGVFLRFDTGRPTQSGEAEVATNHLHGRRAETFTLRNSTAGSITVRVLYGDGAFNPGAAGASVSATIVGTPDVNIASVQAGLAAANRVPVAGGIANGAALAGCNPVIVAGSDGANARSLLTDASGRSVSVGPVAVGAAIGGAGSPLWMGGSDGANVRAVLLDTSGRVINVGAAANGAAVAGNPVMVGGSDGTNARVLATTTTGLQRGIVEAATTGGMTRHRARSAASTNATSVKASAAKLYSVVISNTSVAVRWVKLHNVAVAPTVGTTAVSWGIMVPAGSTFVWDSPVGIDWPTGLAYSIVSLEPDTDATAVAAGDVHVLLGYV